MVRAIGTGIEPVGKLVCLPCQSHQVFFEVERLGPVERSLAWSRGSICSKTSRETLPKRRKYPHANPHRMRKADPDPGIWFYLSSLSLSLCRSGGHVFQRKSFMVTHVPLPSRSTFVHIHTLGSRRLIIIHEPLAPQTRQLCSREMCVQDLDGDGKVL